MSYQAENGKERVISNWVQWGYGVTGFAAINTFTAFVMFGMFFFTDVVGLSPAFSGTILSVVTLWDAITDPVVGFISDKRDPKKGRRRPFLKYVMIPFGIITWLLFTNFELGPTATKVYFIVVALLFYTCQTLLDIPYTSLGVELTSDYDKRSSLSSKRGFFATISGLTTASTLSIVVFFTNLTGDENLGWSLMAALFGILAMISIFIGYKSTAGYELVDLKVTRHDYRKTLIGMLKNKPFLYTLGLFATAVISLAIQNSAFVYYLSYNLGLDDNHITLAFLIAWIPGLLIVAIMNKIAHVFSKKVAWIVAMSAWIISLIVFPIFVLPYYVNMWTIGMLQVISAFGYVPMYQIALSMIADTIEVDEFKTGLRREGTYYGVINFLQKGATSLAILICGSVLTFIGYVPEIEQSQEALDGIKYLSSYIPSIFLVISIIFALLNPMSRTRHNALRQAIMDRNANRKIDTTEFEKLL